LLVPCLTNADCYGNEYPNFVVQTQCQAIPGSGGIMGCVLNQWCPSENIYNPATTQIYDLDGVDLQTITINSAISFPAFNSKVSFTPNAQKIVPYPDAQANTFTVEDILIMAGTTYEDVRYIGTVLNFDIIWSCDYDIFNCQSQYVVTNLDATNSVGYAQAFANPYMNGNVVTRSEYHYSAIKIYINVIGKAGKIEAANILMEVFIFCALVFLCTYIADFTMITFFREKKHYRELKYLELTNFLDGNH
jgi:hypothetical protein